MRDFSLNFPPNNKGNWEPKIPPLFLWSIIKRTHVRLCKTIEEPKVAVVEKRLRGGETATTTARTKATSRKKKRGRHRPAPLLRESHYIVIKSSSHIYISERYKTPISLTTNIGAWRKEKGRQREDNRRKERKKRHHRLVDKMNDESGARATTDDKDDQDIIERTTRGEEVSSSSSSSCFVSFSLFLRVVR